MVYLVSSARNFGLCMKIDAHSLFQYIPGPYLLISNGSLCSNIKYQITSLEECRFASETLGLRWGGSRDGQDLSPACAYAVNANKVYYNLSPGTIQPPRFDALICRRARGTITKISFCDFRFFLKCSIHFDVSFYYEIDCRLFRCST